MVEPIFDYQFRLILIGDSTVGKSSLLKYFTDGKFAEISDPTVGVDFFARLIEVRDGTRIKLQLWDTAGQERFRVRTIECNFKSHAWPCIITQAYGVLTVREEKYLQTEMEFSYMVRCAFCSGLIGQWEQGDDPETEHRRHFPTCSFIIARCTTAEQNPVTPAGITVRESVLDEADSTLKSLGVQNHRIARHPKYTSTDARIATYTTWPGDVAQTPEQLAEAGFYYAGSGDQVRCFHCDGGLSKWDPSDDPWVEHARWFPECGFVVLVRGQNFIDESIELKPPVSQVASGGAGTEKVSAPKRASTSSITNGAASRVRQVTEQELEGLMTTEFATAALQVGLDQSRVKMALRQKVEQTGQAFSSADDLIVATLDIQLEEAPSHESEDTWSTPLNSPLLRRVVRNGRRNSSTEEMRTDDSSDSSDSDSQDIMVKSLPTLQAPHKSPPTVSSLPDITSLNKERSVSLEEENRKLKEARLCKICMDNEVCIVFLPCGHLVTCVNCAHSLADCPVCRQTIKATVRTFLS